MSVADWITLIASIVTVVFSTGTVVVLISSCVREAKARRKSSAQRQEKTSR
ncbi:hypothetical protein BBOMB_1067 [Bifidobacterium bombi DSM 19703]|uniref:Uncharacterized protein n=1 Tax=Bifidobacterium bombi DSM 19703 TaxID=1341695 RepID=A0A080N4S7_9BIFI|nr:hypothetical protein BBOMB_1067 [Bifidobacterium bombi DSM 19703]